MQFNENAKLFNTILTMDVRIELYFEMCKYAYAIFPTLSLFRSKPNIQTFG